MPGLIWLMLHPPRHAIFPPWATQLAIVLFVLEILLLLFVSYCVISDVVKDWRNKR